jgi:hypothetical protein
MHHGNPQHESQQNNLLWGINACEKYQYITLYKIQYIKLHGRSETSKGWEATLHIDRYPRYPTESIFHLKENSQ